MKNVNFRLILFVTIICLFIGFHIYTDKNLLLLPKGEFLYDVASPNDSNFVSVYFINGGPISADAYRVEYNGKNIYYAYPENNIKVEWIDNQYVVINGIKLNVYKDKYQKN